MERRCLFSFVQREGQPARRSKFQGDFDRQCDPQAVSQDCPAKVDEGGRTEASSVSDWWSA